MAWMGNKIVALLSFHVYVSYGNKFLDSATSVLRSIQSSCVGTVLQ